MPAIAFAPFCDQLIALYGPPRAKKTRAKLRQVLGEIRAIRGVRRTSDLTPATIQKWMDSHPDRKPITAHSLLRSLRKACSYAKTMGYLKVDPFDFRSPSEWLLIDEADDVEDFDRHRTADEVSRLLALLDREASLGSWESGRLKALVYTFAFTGMRKMEALGLKVADVDLPNRTIFIRTNEKRKLKTRGSGQPVGIAERLAVALAEWMPRTGCGWLFPGKTLAGPWLFGGPRFRPLDQVKAAGERAGVPGLTMLAFRHTIGTLAEGADLGELELQRWLRHTRRRTQDAYRKKGDIAVIHGTARKIDAMFSGPETVPFPAAAGG